MDDELPDDVMESFDGGLDSGWMSLDQVKKLKRNIAPSGVEKNDCAWDKAADGPVCSPAKIRAALGALSKKLGLPSASNPKQLIANLMKHYNVPQELDLFAIQEVQDAIGGQNVASDVIEENFRVIGPASNDNWLTNEDIDKTMEQWERAAPKLFGKKFKHIPFQMDDFMEYGGPLAELDIAKLRANGYDCFGVILNTDTSNGGGKHWYCVYGDLSGPVVNLEYFNSSGFAPRLSIETWRSRMVAKLANQKPPVDCKETNVICNYSIQKSGTECGMWSLMYIYNRLKGKPINYFEATKANDRDMFEFRKVFFNEFSPAVAS